MKYKKMHILAFGGMLLEAFFTFMLPFITMKIIDDAIKYKNITLLLQYIIVYLLFTLLQLGSKMFSNYLYSIIGKRVVFYLRTRIMSHVQKLSGRYQTESKTGDLMATVMRDTLVMEELSTNIVFSTVSDLLVTFSMLIFLAFLQFDLLLMTVLLQPLMFLCQKKLGSKVLKKTKQYRDIYGEFYSSVQEYLYSSLHFILLNARKYFNQNYFKRGRNLFKHEISLQLLQSISATIASLISALSFVVVLGYGGYKIIIGTLTLGGLIAFIQYSQRLFGPLYRMAQLYIKIQEYSVSIDRVFKILSEPIDTDHDNIGYRGENINGIISLKNVSFNYENSDLLLNNINIDFIPRKITAIVGESGSGKTTIIKLLFRLWDTSNGEILIGGTNIKKFNKKFLRKNISIVSQDIFLFNDTILNNIVLSNTKLPLQKISEICKQADIYDFIMSLPNKYNTMVGERGIKLSGGQKQKISIARALLRNSPIIIFDEATSSLDNLSESKFKDNLLKLAVNKTVIIIAHRLSIVELADNIYVLQNGNVVEYGKHHELLIRKEYYYKLYMKSKNIYTESNLDSAL